MAIGPWVSATGEGIDSVPGGGVNLYLLLWRVRDITNPRIRVLGALAPHQLQYAGMGGFTQHDDGHTGASEIEIVLPFNINWDSMLWYPPNNPTSGAWWIDGVYHKLPPGMTWWYQVWYY